MGILVIIFILVLLTGILLAILFRKQKSIMIGIIALTVIICTPIFFTISFLHEENLRDEITRVIESRGGHIIKIEKLKENDFTTPFYDEVSKMNILFKITYVKDNIDYFAWYRGVKTLNDIHDQTPETYKRGYGEKWIFDS